VRFSTETIPAAVMDIASPSVRLQGVKILIVDDNGTNLRILHTMAERWGMHPTSVSDPARALDELSAAEKADDGYELILTDRYMPKVDGFELVRQIRERMQQSTAIIIMLTSGGQSGDVARCDELGIGTYLLKPVRQAELHQAMIHVLQNRQEPVPPPAVTPHTSGDKGDGLKGLCILLAEDNLVNQKVAMRLLEKRGHRVILATNGEEALAALAQQSFDLVLMDVHMPGTDGIQATIQIREREKLTGFHQAVVAMTALAMKGDRDRCIAAGMDGYISKPIDLRQLDDLLATYADRVPAVLEATIPKQTAAH
jgi:two-component system, sensor histidine kinase and response regulator